MAPADLSRKFQEVLAAYLEAKENGQVIDPQTLLHAHPDLAAELTEFFANEKQFASAAAGFAADTPTVARSVSGARIGEYEILGEIARGGMGVVYRARHVTLRRVVALKMLLGGTFAGREGLRRFQTEAEVVAGLDHPHIVPIYDSGTHDGQAYFCMKLIDGPSLKQQIATYVGKPEDAARLIIRIARAVHHAHQRGILHRDLKPGNILLQTADLRAQNDKKQLGNKAKKYPVSGIAQSAGNLPAMIPYVTDFGLAKRFEADGAASHSTAVVGTAAYMAPEQATGRAPLSVAADVYGLGAILFELLTGKPPFVGQTQLEILLQVAEKDPPSPVQLRSELDRDIAQICLKCLRKNPEERYPSAEALAVELEHWLKAETLTVRAPTLMERMWRGCRRHPLVAGIGALIVLLIAGSIGLNVHLNNLNDQLRAAEEKSDNSEQQLAEQKTRNALDLAERERRARLDAEQANADLLASAAKEKAAREAQAKSQEAELLALKESVRLLVHHYVTNGQQALQRDDYYGAAVWFAEALALDHDDANRAEMHRIRLGTTLRQTPVLAQTWFFDEKIRLVRVGPAGERLLTIDKENAVSLWDAKAGRRIGDPLRHDGGVTAADLSPDGRWLVTAGADGVARVWTTADASPHGNPMKHAKTVHSVAFSGDSQWLATASADKTARVWEVATTRAVGKPMVHDHEARLASFGPDGKKLLTVAEDRDNKASTMRVWDLTSGKEVLKSTKIAHSIRAAGFSRDGKRIYAVSAAHKILLWDYPSGEAIKLAPNLQVKGDQGAWFSPGLDRLLRPGETDVKIVEVPKGTALATLNTRATLAQFSPGGRLVLTASANQGVQLWRPENGRPIGPALPHSQVVSVAQFSSNEQWLATVTEDRLVRLWQLAPADRDKLVSVPKNKGTLLAVSPDGKRALLAQTKSLVIWDFEQGRVTGAGISLGGPTLSVCWSDDGKSVALASRDEVRIWSPASNKLSALALKYDKNEVPETAMQVRFSTDRKELAVWGKSHFWSGDSNGTSLQRKFNKQTHVLDWDGQRVAHWRNKGTLEIQEWANEKMKPLQKLGVQPEFFRFSPDRKTGVAAFADGSMRIWDLADGKPITLPIFTGEPIKQIAYSPDGRSLATVGISGRCRVWEGNTGQPLSPAFVPAGPLMDIAFRADSPMLLGWTSDSQVHRWNLRPREGTTAGLVRLVRRSAGQTIDPASGSLVPLDAATLRELWGMP